MLVIIVGGIPIAMPTVLSVTLALGAYKLAKVRARLAPPCSGISHRRPSPSMQPEPQQHACITLLPRTVEQLAPQLAICLQANHYRQVPPDCDICYL